MKRITQYLRCRPGGLDVRLFAAHLAILDAVERGREAGRSDRVGARVAGLSAVYGKAFSVWLEDDSPSLDKTMATLDRGLKNGERALQNMEKVCGTVCGFLREFRRSFRPEVVRTTNRRQVPPPASV